MAEIKKFEVLVSKEKAINFKLIYKLIKNNSAYFSVVI